MWTSSQRARVALSLALVVGACVVVPARAQFTLGQQRAGTSSGTFLKIGVGARATALGESFVAVANDPTRRSTGIPPGSPRCSARRSRSRTSSGRPTSATSTSRT